MERIIHISIHLFKQQRKQTQQMQKETIYECFGISFAEISKIKGYTFPDNLRASGAIWG